MSVRSSARPDQSPSAGQASIAPDAAQTYWEEVNRSDWSRYLTAIEKRAVTLAAEAAGGRGVSLEIGCDGGRWSCMLAEQGWKVLCTDTRKEALELTKHRLPQARCLLVNPTDTTLPCEAESINLLLCVEVEAVSNRDWFIPEAARVLKRGGVVMTTLLNRSSLRALVHASRKRNPSKPGSLGRYEVAYGVWRRALVQSGLRPIYEQGFCWAPFSRNSNSRAISWFVGAERLLGLHRLTTISPWVAAVAQKS